MEMRSTADCRCGLVVRPVRRCKRGQQRVDHPGHRRLAVGAGDVDRRVAALRRAEQSPSARRSGPCSARSWSPANAGRADARPAAAPRSRRASGRPRSRSDRRTTRGHVSPARRAVMRSTSSRASCWRARILSTTSAGALARNASLPSLPAVPAQFLLRGGEILLQPAPLGGDVDGARRVELDDHGAPRQPHLDGRRRSEAVRRLGEPGQRRHGGHLGVQVGVGDLDSRAGTFCRSSSPWSLRNRRTSVTSFCMSAIRCAATDPPRIRTAAASRR